ncbi:MAG: membrane dipeptidase [Alphaproteobacteria bacterium]|nr:membrane dipeptidase [Alphaproteobacteria bacterium]
MRIDWPDLRTQRAARLHGVTIDIEGWIVTDDLSEARNHFALIGEPSCCIACLPRDPLARIEVFASTPIMPDSNGVRLTGRLVCLDDDEMGWRYQLREARLMPSPVAPGFTRRAALAGGALFGLSSWAPLALAADPDAAAIAAARQAMDGAVTADLHSHAGAVIRMREPNLPFVPLAAPMREGRMAVVCLAVVSDGPVIGPTDNNTRIRPNRTPAPGELYSYAQIAFGRLQQLVREQQLGVITSAAAMRAAHPDRPSVLVTSEGGDFLEGRPERVDEAYEKWNLRQIQLTHYRVNELGDIQTEPTEHNGLTEAGVAVIRRCNARGVIVDVAHGTTSLVRRAAEVTTKPLILSHTSFATSPGRFSRLVSAEHARLVARTGGVIGIWPPTSIFPDVTAYAAGMARMVDAVGIDHVGIGSDMMGLLGPSALPSYSRLPAVAAALMARGFNAADMRKLVGGNYLRVALANLA